MDEKSLTLLKSLLQDGHEEIDYSQEAQLNELWITLIEKSIICLRFFDTREPFLKNSDKKPIAYNIKDLSDGFTFGKRSFLRRCIQKISDINYFYMTK